MSKKIAAVAMSGGVDSSLTAALLLEQGYDVIGITMLLSEEGRGGALDLAGGELPDSVIDAHRVADKLGIKHYTVDFRKEFQENVIEYFLSEYAKGRTPNPCVMCNPSMKFGLLLDKALELLDGREPGICKIAVNPRSRSKLTGNKKSNLKVLSERGYTLEITEDDSIHDLDVVLI